MTSRNQAEQSRNEIAASAVGKHCLLELWGCACRVLDDPERVRQALEQAARCGGFTVVGSLSHHFTPQGVTAMLLLAESHIAVHTWPETGYAAADVFSCGPQADPAAACASLVASLGATDHHLLTLPRGPIERPAQAHRVHDVQGTRDRE